MNWKRKRRELYLEGERIDATREIREAVGFKKSVLRVYIYKVVAVTKYGFKAFNYVTKKKTNIFL
jgi:hypothetical protein